MRITQLFAHAIVRRIAYVLVAAVLVWCGMGKAYAQQPAFTCTSLTKCDRQQAYAECQVFAAYSGQSYPGHTYACTLSEQYPAQKVYKCKRTTSPSLGSPCLVSELYAFRECDAPKVWNESLKQCFSPSECLARNADLAPGTTTRNFVRRCVAGCELKLSGPSVGVEGLYSGVYQYTGNMCEPGPTIPAGSDSDAKDRPPQTCTPAGDGQTFCLKPDGQHCYSASNGRQVCWRPGETGEKDDGPVKQKRDAGNEPVPPNLQLPSGDSLTPKGPPVTKTTQIDQGGGNVQTITTTTQNYQTTHGTNAGSKNSGESASGDGSGKDEGEGSASGGGDCKTPPITSGDPVLGMVATQAWHTRCAVEAGNAAKVTGDVADCKQPFTVEGTNANAVKLRAMRAQLCNGDKNGNGRPDWTETNGTETPEPGEGEEEPGFLSKYINTDALDGGGFLGGSGSCPQMGTVDLHFVQVDLSNASWWCPFVSMCRAILLLMGAYIAIRLLME